MPVYRAVQILSSGIGSLTIDTWRSGEAFTPPLWIRQPDAKLTPSEFLEQTATSLALQGNAFWRVVRDTPTAPINALIVLDPNEVVVHKDGTYGWRDKTFRNWEVQHLRLLSIPGRELGLGPIQAAQSSLGGAIDLRNYAAEWFTSGAVPNGILSTDQKLNAETAKRYQEQWDEKAGRGTAVMGDGFKYDPILLTPEQALWIEAQQFSKTDIATLFGIPPHLMLAAVEGGTQTYANIGQADLNFMRHTLTAYSRKIEEAFTALLPRTSVARFNLDAILRPDTATRYAAHATALSAGFLTVNEVRALEGLPPVAGGDVLTKSAPKETTPND